MKTSREIADEAEAKLRTERARIYAQKFPDHTNPGEPYGTFEWQVEQLSKYRERCADAQKH